MKTNTKKRIIAIAIPLGVGVASSLITMNAFEAYESFPRAPLSPPAFLFPIVWTILFILMGIASYLVAVSADTENSKKALILYGVQLVVNFFWPIFFFNLQWFTFAFIWLAILWLLIIATGVAFSKINLKAAALLIPYFLWTSFAGYLNLFVAMNTQG